MSDRPADPWHILRRHTAARIALGRVGDGLPLAHLLDFQMAHARARDSVHMPLDFAALEREIAQATGLAVRTLRSAAPDRALYLQRPDLGRQLAEGEAAKLPPGPYEVVFVIGDGLSSRAVKDHAAATLRALQVRLAGWHIGPVILARQARVALADGIGAAMGAAMTVMLIGERPGLSSADSLGAYLTWGPRPGLQNSARNCVSNIRPEGLLPEAAAAKIAWLMNEARRLKLSGVALKDDVPEALPDNPPTPPPFLP
ncbi:ethanolamine ammonia-lyase subunit EutC [Telmatospirillum sp. J64-1]|uniref:ethanolamine ammonia-lyase subunit EutC n=1 Tax=Telmatospirillum sp. J64-1 TaxID=2502183 RepID=UPI00115F345C|nr:ethanolamine ammonia-lyase subunit EutC [Telmatospirillum sp. J64-1]